MNNCFLGTNEGSIYMTLKAQSLLHTFGVTISEFVSLSMFVCYIIDIQLVTLQGTNTYQKIIMHTFSLFSYQLHVCWLYSMLEMFDFTVWALTLMMCMWFSWANAASILLGSPLKALVIVPAWYAPSILLRKWWPGEWEWEKNLRKVKPECRFAQLSWVCFSWSRTETQ